MNDTPQACPKCGGAMVQGFIVERVFGGFDVHAWAEGPPRGSFWQGMQVNLDQCYPVGTFRCADCGYLESYARVEFAKK